MKKQLHIKTIHNKNVIIEQIIVILLENDGIISSECVEKVWLMTITVSYTLPQLMCFAIKLLSDANYQRNVFQYLYQLLLKTRKSKQERILNADLISILINVKLKPMDHRLAIDKKWNKCILKLVEIRYNIEENLAWLSTLGGAYSSLGDHNYECALKAGQIAMSQLCLASVCGDPNMIARCGIYMGYSLCQTGQTKKAIKLIKNILYPYISNIVNRENILKNMYSALCYRVTYISKYKICL